VHGRGQPESVERMDTCIHNLPMIRLTSHASGTEQVVSPEIVAYYKGKCECMQGTSTHRDSREHACMYNSPMRRLTWHARLVEQVAFPEIFANCTGKYECMERASTHRGSGEYTCTIHP
jgi:hypothetical protein